MASRREFLVAAGLLPFFGRRNRVAMAGISFRVVRGHKSAHRYLHIHGDEATARQVLIENVQARGGVGLLIQSDTRNVPVAGGKIDPNRMFSREGALRSLKSLNKDWTDAQVQHAADLLDRERHKFLKAITPPKGGRIVALHNNAKGYSVEAEIAASDRTSLKDASNPHEFFLATDPRDFDKLAALPCNVVVQQTPAAQDDGSLSRLAAKLGVRYINLECAFGKLERQRELLGWLERELG
ncbi:MAG TPA: hypothetical protein VMT15_17945 [Bryobacteraceae bacterium]|nr:hypothetical protein [Bryobacteraceae bacterium]